MMKWNDDEKILILYSLAQNHSLHQDQEGILCFLYAVIKMK